MNRKERGHTEKLVARLVADGLIELVEGGEVEAVIEEVGNHLVLWSAEAGGERGEELGELLTSLRPVAEVFASDEALQVAIDRWRRAVRGPEIVVTDERNAEIEARLAAEEDDELAAVYADWLIEHGNPVGELFACATDEKARRRVLAKLGGVLWGPVADYAKLFEVTWGKTGIVGVAVERTTAFELEWGRVIGALLDRPIAAFCRSLSIGPLPAEAWSQFYELLDVVAARRPRETLRRLALRGGTWNAQIRDIATGYPRLASFEIEAGYVQSSIAHPGVETLTLRLDSLPAVEHVMARAELPRLRTLALAVRHATVGEPLGKLVDMPWFGQLEALDVSGLGATRQVVTEHYGRQVSHLRIS
jgi:uncharacterized protein (TIGR02996 family)